MGAPRFLQVLAVLALASDHVLVAGNQGGSGQFATHPQQGYQGGQWSTPQGHRDEQGYYGSHQ